MKKLPYQGSAITQYLIIIALIGLCCIPVFFILGGSIVEHFTNFKAAMNGNISNADSSGKDGESIDPDVIVFEKGSLGGTPTNPKMECTDSICNIDYGTFVLSGLPENFNSFIKSSGASGGSEKISDLLSQLADQLEENDQPDEALELRKLASIGHNMALTEKTFEDVVKSCGSDAACIQGFDSQTFPKPEGFDETFYSFTII